MSSGSTVPQIGPVKLKIVELLCVVLQMNITPLTVERLLECKAPHILLQMMCKYHSSSIFHSYVVQFIRQCLRVSGLREALFNDYKILDFLVDNAKKEWNKPITERYSYSGCLSLLVEAITKLDFDPFVFELLSESEKWTQFENDLYSTYLTDSFFRDTPNE